MSKTTDTLQKKAVVCFGNIITKFNSIAETMTNLSFLQTDINSNETYSQEYKNTLVKENTEKQSAAVLILTNDIKTELAKLQSITTDINAATDTLSDGKVGAILPAVSGLAKDETANNALTVIINQFICDFPALSILAANANNNNIGAFSEKIVTNEDFLVILDKSEAFIDNINNNAVKGDFTATATYIYEFIKLLSELSLRYGVSLDDFISQQPALTAYKEATQEVNLRKAFGLS